jgi:Cu/Ag efflux protein CusF
MAKGRVNAWQLESLKKKTRKKEMNMTSRKKIASLAALIAGIVLSLTWTNGATAQEKKPGAQPKEDRVSGAVQMIDKNSSTLTLRKDNIHRAVVYTNDTKFTKHDKPASLDDVKEGRRVICLGKFDEKARLVATRIDVRTETP